MMKKSMNTFLVVLACLVCVGRTRSYDDKKPNIVYILADDLGWNDLGIHNPKLITPNIDGLAKKGIELTNSYAQPICSPSRSALMTGKYPSNNGLQHIVILAESQTCLPLEHRILPEYMKREGYVTKYIGKWHLGYCNRDCLPENRGIDEFSGMLGGECDYYTWDHNNVTLKNKGNEPTVEDLGTHLLLKDIEETKKLIGSHNTNQPLFMIVSPTAPHIPLTATPEMLEAHDHLDFEGNETEPRRQYLGLVSGLDDLVGETVQALEEAGIADNTIIVFQSDNGGASIESCRVRYASHGNNYPLRNSKYSFHDGGTKVPTIYYDPRLHPKTRGTKRNFLMHISDWLPTFLQLANGKRRLKNIDGISQVSNLGNSYKRSWRYKKRHEMLVALTTIADDGFECSNRDAAFRWRDWKLIYGELLDFSVDEDGNRCPVDDEWPRPAESLDLPKITGDSCYREENGTEVVRCLFNMRTDPSERRNLYDTHPRIVKKLLRKIEKAKEEIMRSVFTPSLGVTDETTREFEDVLVPRHDYCTSSEHFPLEPNPSSCDA